MHSVRSHRRALGFTLTELLVVMGIAAVLGALTVVSVVAVGRRGAREGAAQDVASILRQARLLAVDGGRGAVVRIDTLNGTLFGLARKIEAAWHFEQMDQPDPSSSSRWETPGAKSLHARPRDAAGLDPDDSLPDVVEGVVGLCFRLNYDAGAGQYDDSRAEYVDCSDPRNYPVYDQTDGIRLEAYVRPEANGPSGSDRLPVFHKVNPGNDEGYYLNLVYHDELASASMPVAGYGLRGGFYVRGTGWVELDTETDPVANTTDRPPLRLQPGWFYHVAIEYDGFQARLLVNGVVLDVDSYDDDEDTDDPNDDTDETFDAGEVLVPARNQPLLIGSDGADYFEGLIDEPQLLSVAGGQRVQLPEGVPMVTTDEAVYFDGQGYLDLSQHTAHVLVALGDPYQATKAQSLGPPVPDPILLLGQNPFPPTGGLVMVGNQVVQYDDVDGLELRNIRSVPSNWCGGVDDDVVRYARTIRIGLTGLVERVTRMMP